MRASSFLPYALLGGTLASLVLGSSCGSNNNVQPSIPTALVNELVDLTSVQAAPLRFNNGYIYLNAGVRGIVVVRQSAQQYLAFERNCPYQPYNSCAKVSMDRSGFFMADSCCSSRFDLQGLPTSGPATLALRRYSTSLNGNLLYITSQ